MKEMKEMKEKCSFCHLEGSHEEGCPKSFFDNGKVVLAELAFAFYSLGKKAGPNGFLFSEPAFELGRKMSIE